MFAWLARLFGLDSPRPKAGRPKVATVKGPPPPTNPLPPDLARHIVDELDCADDVRTRLRAILDESRQLSPSRCGRLAAILRERPVPLWGEPAGVGSFKRRKRTEDDAIYVARLLEHGHMVRSGAIEKCGRARDLGWKVRNMDSGDNEKCPRCPRSRTWVDPTDFARKGLPPYHPGCRCMVELRTRD